MRIDRDSTEIVAVTITVPAGTTPTDFQVSITANGMRPVTWAELSTLAAGHGVLIGPGSQWPLTPGEYRVWLKVTATPETAEFLVPDSLIIT